MMNQTTKSLSAEVSGAAERSLQATTHALETTRELARQVMESSGNKVREAREGIKDASAAAQWQMGRYAKRTRRYVSERPVATAFIAAALGAAVAALAVALVRSRRR